MKRHHRSLCGLLICVALVACNKDTPEDADNALVKAQEVPLPAAEIVTNEENPLAAVVGASEIPYPVYPNGTKYRVGGENGLKIVVFQTEDTFDKVDEYYNGLSDNAGMARIMAMNDYVRYSNNSDDIDPWATHRPGIVIHEFESDNEREAVGASAVANTNIIMSF